MNLLTCHRSRRTMNWALIPLFLMLIGCSAPSRQTIITLDAPGPAERLAVDIENFRGGVIVIADPDRTDIEIQTTIVASRKLPKADLEYVFESIAVSSAVEVEPTQSDGFNTLRVRATSLRPHATDVSSNLVIRVPRCDGARVLNTQGHVELVDVAGAMHVDNTNGAIFVRTSRPLIEPITLLTSHGNIYCQAPEGTTGVMDLHSVDGRLVLKDAFGTSTDIAYTAQHLRARLGDGTNPIVMRTNIGQVRMLLMKEPMAFTRAVKTSLPRLRKSLYLKGSRRHTLNLPDASSAEAADN